MSTSNQQKKIFLAYSKKDRPLLDELVSHLSVLERSGSADVWFDGEIEAGDEWEQSKVTALQTADIILLLISADFINSDYCYEVEMQGALKRHAAGSAKVVPILMRDCAWELTPFAKLKILPTNKKPIANDKLEVSDKALADVVEEVFALVHPTSTIFHGEKPKEPVLQKTVTVNSTEGNSFKKIVFGVLGIVLLGLGVWGIPKMMNDTPTHANEKTVSEDSTPRATEDAAGIAEEKKDAPTLKPTPTQPKINIEKTAKDLKKTDVIKKDAINDVVKKPIQTTPPPVEEKFSFKTFKNGNQIWMAENVKTNLNRSICYDESNSNCQKYGKLYTFNAAKKSCPSGWHLPKIDEWKKLLSSQGENFSGNQKGKVGYQFLTGRNFDAPLAGMLRAQPKAFKQKGEVGYYWTSSHSSGDEVYVIKVDGTTKRLELIKEYLGRKNAFSCRCVKSK